jgi:hypothetical protein
MRNFLITLAVLVLIAGLGLVVWTTWNREPQVLTNNEVTASSTPDHSDIVRQYIESHISTLSPQKEVLGGTFYVTNVVTGPKTGVVSYEDGHNAYVADFNYTVDDAKGVHVTGFIVRPTATSTTKTP